MFSKKKLIILTFKETDNTIQNTKTKLMFNLHGIADVAKNVFGSEKCGATLMVTPASLNLFKLCFDLKRGEKNDDEWQKFR